jgi:sec-independent protein translocase protein TatA
MTRAREEWIVIIGEIFGPDLLVVVIVVAVLIFGGSAIPKLARNLGQAKNEFERGLKSAKTVDESTTEATALKALGSNQ